MFYTDSLNVAFNRGGDLASKGLLITAKPNSILSQFTEISSPNSLDITDRDGFVSTMKTLNNGESMHSSMADGLISDLKDLVLSHVSLAKNVVRPEVIELVTNIEAFLEKNKTIDPASDFNIIVSNLPEVLLSDIVLDDIKSYKNSDPVYPKDLLAIQEKPEDLLGFILTGSNTVDSMIKSWILTQPEDYLDNIWTSWFADQKEWTKYGSVVSNSTDRFAQAGACFAVYLICKRLLKDPVSVPGMNLPDYERTIYQLRDYVGSILSNALVACDSIISTKTLLTDKSHGTKTVTVCGPVYNEWIKAGGSPEVLLGVLVSNASVGSVTAVDEKREKFIEAWEDYCTYQSMTIETKLLFSLKSFLVEMLGREMTTDLTEIEQEYIKNNPSYVENVMRLARDYIETLDKSTMLQVGDIAHHLSTKCRFYFTASGDILSGVSDAMRHNPKMTTRQAAYVACLKYLCSFFKTQVTVTKF
jgi:hypothetical protein